MIGIYCIRNLINGKMYVGQSTNVEKRMVFHFSKLKKGKHYNPKLQNAWNLHGWESFVFEIIKECSVEELDYLEKEIIKNHDTVSSGYNLQEGGNKNKILTQEHKDKIAKANTGRKLSLEAVEKIRKANTGRVHKPPTEEQRKRHSEFMRGKQMRLGKRGQKFSEETRGKMSNSKIGNQNAKGSKRTEEEKQHLREIMTGKKRPFKGHTQKYYLDHPEKCKDV